MAAVGYRISISDHLWAQSDSCDGCTKPACLYCFEPPEQHEPSPGYALVKIGDVYAEVSLECWVGYLRGYAVAVFSSQGQGDAAIRRREVEATTSVEWLAHCQRTRREQVAAAV